MTGDRSLANVSALVYVGRPCVDIVAQGNRLPRVGEKIIVENQLTLGGGVGGNFAAMASHLGATVTTLGLDSADPLAEVDKKSLSRVDARWFGEGAVEPILCYIFVTEGGGRSVFINYPIDDPKALQSLHSAIPDVTAEFGGREKTFCYLGVLRDEAIPLAKSATADDIPIVCTLEHSDWPGNEALGVLQVCDLVFVADETFEAHESEIVELQAEADFALVITLGAGGSVFRNNELGEVRTEAVAGPLGVVDTSGAGDAFAAAFSVMFFSTRDPMQSLDFASRVAGFHVGYPGARVNQELLDGV